MTISVGETLPEASFFRAGEKGPEKFPSSEIFAGKKVVLFGLPGAFTPTCNNNHLPGFIEHEATIRSKGVDEIVVVSINDVFVMDAWASISGGEGKITFVSDPFGEFVKSIGLDIDLSVASLGVRSQRFAMVVDDGKVTALNVDKAPSEATEASAVKILQAL